LKVRVYTDAGVLSTRISGYSDYNPDPLKTIVLLCYAWGYAILRVIKF